jgi:pilus assembly protein Flp/PilA
MLTFISALVRDDRGATAIEYAMIASVISIAILSAASSIGSSLVSSFGSVANSF